MLAGGEHLVTITVEIYIHAPIELCFDLARDIGVHTRTVWKHTREEAVAGVTSGPIGEGETVTFRATHLGVRQHLTSRISAYKRPVYFVDEMVQGAFRSLRHEHHFARRGEGTLMRDVLVFEAPLGLLGRIAEALVLRWYMKKFLEHRNLRLKELAEEKASATSIPPRP